MRFSYYRERAAFFVSPRPKRAGAGMKKRNKKDVSSNHSWRAHYSCKNGLRLISVGEIETRRMELVDGIEPSTCWLRINYSTYWATPASVPHSQPKLCFGWHLWFDRSAYSNISRGRRLPSCLIHRSESNRGSISFRKQGLAEMILCRNSNNCSTF